MSRTALLAAFPALVIALDWLRLEQPRSGGARALVLAALAILPALLGPLRLRLAGVFGSAILGLWVAFSVSPAGLWPGGEGYFGPLASRFGSGFADFYEFRLPIDPARHASMHMVILVAIFAFTLALALAIAARRAFLAVLLFVLAAGWPATILAGGNELGRGAVILAGALVLLAGVGGGAGRLAAAAAAAVVLGALALSSSPAVAKSAFLDWQHWNLSTHAQKPVAVRYVWNANYNGIQFPSRRTTVLTIRGPRTPLYWRATTLDVFAANRWQEDVWKETADESRRLAAAGARDASRWIHQDVTVGALDDDHLIAATIPVQYTGDTPVEWIGQGVGRIAGGLQRDQSYVVWSYVPSPTPAELVRVPGTYPRALTRPGRELDLAPGVAAPPFGSPNREDGVRRLLAGRLEPYTEVFERARAVAGETTSPYAVTVALETWLRTTGGFTYSEQPAPTPGLPPLVGFVAETKAGYCQHFAGSMALMLRLLGIPARVGAGFVSGHYRDGAWTVTDHDAHTWVEVWFRGYGWLPFDPTPGRGHLGGPYSSTSLGFDRTAASRLLARVVRGGEVFGDGTSSPGSRPNVRFGGRSADGPDGALAAATSGHRGASLLGFLALLAAALAGATVLLKAGRRQLRYLSRDPRRVASACVRELMDFLRDQRITVSGASTLRELAYTVDERLGVDARRFAGAAATARYGPPGEAAAAADRARHELRQLKRQLRRTLVPFARFRGLLSLRSLGFGQ